jgi:hypothetical protein
MKVKGRGRAPPVRQLGRVRATLSGKAVRVMGAVSGRGTGLKPSTERFDLLIFYIHGH